MDWRAHGFELCGEAPDGETALPLLQATKPDVLITGIKMPFMDGLQLCKIVRERMPGMKVVILSGHDEFDYAQKAIKLGVAEYLLKPVTVQQLHQVLQRLALQLDREREEQAAVQGLRQQVEESRAALIERLWFKLLVGALPLPDAIEQSEALSFDLIARCYLVVVIRIASRNSTATFDYAGFDLAQDIVSGVVGNDPDVSVLRKDLEELVLILKGNTPEYLIEARDVLLNQIQARMNETTCQLIVGAGAPRSRITDLGQSFIEALAAVENAAYHELGEPAAGGTAADWLKVDKSALEDYLQCGVSEELEEFFDGFIFATQRHEPVDHRQELHSSRHSVYDRQVDQAVGW